jgi:hypothetical protein
MSRAYRVALAFLVPAVFALVNVVMAARAAAGPCLPGEFGC